MCQPLPTRRDALKKVFASAAGLAVAPSLVFATAPDDAVRLGSFALSLASYPVLRNTGGSVVVDVPTATGPESTIVVTHRGAGEYAAVSAICTHAETILNPFSTTNNRITCPNHGSQFSATGTVLRGPASSPLPSYPAAYEAASDSVRVTLATVTAGEPAARADALALAVAPSVVRGTATARFRLPAPAPVRLAVYDALGREVAVLIDGSERSGDVSAAWDARGAAPGVYVFRLASGAHAAAASVRVVR